MGESTKGEKGVLKLVHPGRHIEIHIKPITAAEVMSKNPRHCVARPDFFKFPYIVVRPESVLYPGQVLYIVPNCVIYKLLHSKPEVQNKNNSRKRQSPRKCVAGSDRRDSSSSYLKAWPMINVISNSYLEYRKTTYESSVEKDRSLSRNENSRNDSSNVAEVGNHDIQNSCVKFHNQINRPKPCLKKHDRVQSSRDQKVTFVSPIVTRSY